MYNLTGIKELKSKQTYKDYIMNTFIINLLMCAAQTL